MLKYSMFRLKFYRTGTRISYFSVWSRRLTQIGKTMGENFIMFRQFMFDLQYRVKYIVLCLSTGLNGSCCGMYLPVFSYFDRYGIIPSRGRPVITFRQVKASLRVLAEFTKIGFFCSLRRPQNLTICAPGYCWTVEDGQIIIIFGINFCE
jgi:hypothetical protein